jgi:uncharacterized coiled-coil DUF342 family protein
MKNENKLLEYISPNIRDSFDNQEITNNNNQLMYGLKNKIKELNQTLSLNGYNEIGDLFDHSFISLNKTIGVLQTLLDDRQKLTETRADLMHRSSKQEHDTISLHEKIEGLNAKITDLNNRNNNFKNKLTNNEKKYFEDIEKIRLEKEEANKNVTKISMKENQYKHEIKKLEKEIDELKTKLRKLMAGGRDNSPVRSGNFRTIDNTSFTNLSIINKDGFNTLDNNSIKNSPIALNNINHMRDFYKLLFEAFNEKTKTILNENKELKDCYSLIYKEISQYIEFKKLIIQKVTKDTVSDISNELFNDKIFRLDFNDNKEMVLNNFNDLINIFRFVLIYDFLKIDPSNEFNLDNAKKMINNKKYNFDDIPYYKDVKSIIEGFDVKNVNMLKGLLFKNEEGGDFASSRLSSYRNNNTTNRFVSERNNNTKRSNFSNNNFSFTQTMKGGLYETLEGLNKDLMESINVFEKKVGKIENDLACLETSDK